MGLRARREHFGFEKEKPCFVVPAKHHYLREFAATCLALAPPIPGSPLEYSPYKTVKLSMQKTPDAHGVEARASKAGTCRPPIGQNSTGAFSAAERSVDTQRGFLTPNPGVSGGFRGFPGVSG